VRVHSEILVTNRSRFSWKEVPPFSEIAAREFLRGSGLQVSDDLLNGVLREAAEIEQTKGLIRPVTINLCGRECGYTRSLRDSQEFIEHKSRHRAGYCCR